MKKLNKKGFTLAELLIVVAIIAVLVAIAIPVFSSQLEKSREAVDLANIRAAYAETQTSVITTGVASYKKVVPVQSTEGWTIDSTTKVADKTLEEVGNVVKGTTIYVQSLTDGTWSVETTKPTTGTDLDNTTGD